METDRAPAGPTHATPGFAKLKRRLGSFLLGLTGWAIIAVLVIPPLVTGLNYLLKL